MLSQISWSVGSLLGAVLAYALVNSLGWRVWIAASSVPLLFAATLVTVSAFNFIWLSAWLLSVERIMMHVYNSNRA